MRVRDFREFEFVLLQRAAWLRDQAESDEDARGEQALPSYDWDMPSRVGPLFSCYYSCYYILMKALPYPARPERQPAVPVAIAVDIDDRPPHRLETIQRPHTERVVRQYLQRRPARAPTARTDDLGTRRGLERRRQARRYRRLGRGF